MIPNHAKFNAVDIYSIFDEDSLININEDFNSVGVSIDSRNIDAKNIFVALYGEKIDGHSKVSDAFAAGAACCLVDKKWFDANASNFPDESFIVVDDNLTALGSLANYHRQRFDLPIIAIGGSNGKTTTKELCAAVLSVKYNTLKTYGNFNNRLGVPLMLLQLDDSYQAAVLEIGTNEPGEVHILSEMIEPTHGLITNIGKEHLELLIDLDGVEQEETALFGFLLKKGGHCLINFDDDRLVNYYKVLNKKLTFGTHADAALKADIEINDSLNPIINFHYNSNSISVNMQTIGFASAYNAIAAAAAGILFDLTLEEIAHGLSNYTPEINHGYARMVFENVGDFKILNDCYNANPSSMAMALKTLKAYRTNNPKIAVLGEMRELGNAASLEHIELIKSAAGLCDYVFVIGNEMAKANSEFQSENIILFDSHSEIAEHIINKFQTAAILVKGSRGMKMELFIDALKSKLN